jgi:ribosomal protein S18 acetylase RimI-like enzyme
MKSKGGANHPVNNISIREILSAETEAYNRFLDAAVRSDEESLLITSTDISGALFPTQDRNDSFTLGAYDGDVLAGVVSFVREGEQREKLRHKGFMSSMYVTKNYRGQGIARLLLEEVIKRAGAIEGMEQINLIVISSNTAAQQLYKSFGFEKFGTEKQSIKWKGRYFDEDLMSLRLR